jgi:hypothetical protein
MLILASPSTSCTRRVLLEPPRVLPVRREYFPSPFFMFLCSSVRPTSRPSGLLEEPPARVVPNLQQPEWFPVKTTRQTFPTSSSRPQSPTGQIPTGGDPVKAFLSTPRPVFPARRHSASGHKSQAYLSTNSLTPKPLATVIL